MSARRYRMLDTVASFWWWGLDTIPTRYERFSKV